MSHPKASSRIDALILSVGDRTGHELTKSDATLILRDLDAHARGQQFAGKRADRMVVDEFFGIKVVSDPNVPEGELWIQQSGRPSMRIKTDEKPAEKLCPYHGNDYRPRVCVFCAVIQGGN